jgi:hypothetical protein
LDIDVIDLDDVEDEPMTFAAQVFSAATARFHDSMWFWELAAMLRRVAFLATGLFFTARRGVQIGLGTAVLAVSLVLHYRCAPYRHPGVNTLETRLLALSLSLFATGAVLEYIAPWEERRVGRTARVVVVECFVWFQLAVLAAVALRAGTAETRMLWRDWRRRRQAGDDDIDKDEFGLGTRTRGPSESTGSSGSGEHAPLAPSDRAPTAPSDRVPPGITIEGLQNERPPLVPTPVQSSSAVPPLTPIDSASSYQYYSDDNDDDDDDNNTFVTAEDTAAGL